MSPKFKIDIDDVKNVGKNALLVGVAAALTYVGANLASIDMGIYGALIVPVISTGLDSAIKWLKDNSKA
ncbi:MAG: hypothetical protein WAO78_04670 [Roseovarius sp.]|jgi:hypothetical protein